MDNTQAASNLRRSRVCACNWRNICKEMNDFFSNAGDNYVLLSKYLSFEFKDKHFSDSKIQKISKRRNKKNRLPKNYLNFGSVRE